MSGKQTYQQEEQIMRYLQNQMTEAERHDFEREMQRDPFLREAVEGLSTVAPNSVFSDIEELRKHMVKPERNRRYIWIAAASVVLLIVSSLVFLNLPENVVPFVSENKIQKEVIPKEIKMEEKNNVTPPSPTVVPEKNKKEEVVTLNDELVVEDAEMESVSVTSIERADLAKPLKEVTKNQKLSEETIKISDSTAKTYNSQVSYLTAPAQNKDAENIFDKKKSELNEVVVVGYGTQRKSSMTGSVSSVPTKQMIDGKAFPVGGWKAFDEYLETEISAPKIGKPGKKTIVRLSFEITEAGGKAKFEILKGEDETYNNEAIRIITDGPAWIPEVKRNTPQKSVVKLKLVFEPK